MTSVEASQKIKEIYRNATLKIVDIHNKRILLLKEVLSRRNKEKSIVEKQKGTKIDNKDPKEQVLLVQQTLQETRQKIEDLKHQRVEIIKQAEKKHSLAQADIIRQKLVA